MLSNLRAKRFEYKTIRRLLFSIQIDLLVLFSQNNAHVLKVRKNLQCKGRKVQQCQKTFQTATTLCQTDKSPHRAIYRAEHKQTTGCADERSRKSVVRTEMQKQKKAQPWEDIEEPARTGALPNECMAIESLTTLDLPMVVDTIGIYELKGPYYTLTMTDWFLQALSLIPRGSWGDVARLFTMVRWVDQKNVFSDSQ
ncbi:aldose 1-epimerase-like [Dorcoceras hygrometricum]|uniref:Aldose 1-epimerase-like n=1 Tax=Dorcoceras hygrometricum TaxID=472368 RepID=A0A2Z7C7H9_9LAMI|nr:aldose 1-epimerase-like [Dorcoceras hygrometricum]